MRILAVRGQNLASLAGPFEIDLSAEPLAGAGLFAITGETGAGKSTLLDALCLALYGDYPRVKVGRRESAPDASGEAMSVEDARAILRRGAGAGFAEVDFVGQDGVAYRAFWGARRARGKANGRLQPEERWLKRLADDAAVATGKTETRAAVERVTDLTFEQFRRTVLLAQGEFDAFLLAAEGERAELLEKITGTEVYAVLSMRVHAGTEERRRAVGVLEQRSADIGLLTPEDRRALEAEQGRLASEARAKDEARRTLAANAERLGRIADARRQLAEAIAVQEAAQIRHGAAGSDRGRLAAWNAVEPLRDTWREVGVAVRSLARAEDAERAASVQLAATTREAEAAVSAAEQEATRHAEAAGRFEAHLPLWEEAGACDSKLAAAEAEVVAAEAELRRAADAHTGCEAEVAALGAAAEALEQDAASTVRALATGAAWAPLADRLPEALQRLAERRTLATLLAEQDGAAQNARASAETARTEMVERARQSETVRAARDTAVAEREHLASRLAALDEPGLSARADLLSQAAELLRAADAQARRHAGARAALARAEADIAAARAAWEAAGGRIAAATAERERQAAALDEVRALADLAEGSASAEAVRLRSLMVEGEPCPVCGSREHPHLAHPGALDLLVEEMRRRRAELERAIQAAERARAEAEAEKAAAIAQGKSARAVETQARADLAEAVAAYGGALPALTELCAAGSLAAPPADPDPVRLALLLDDLVRARAALAEPLDAARTLRTALEAARVQADALGRDIDRIAAALSTAQTSVHQAEMAAAEGEREVRTLTERRAALARDVTPFLEAAGLTADALDDADLADRLSDAARDYEALRAAARAQSERRQELASQRAAGEAQLAAARSTEAVAAEGVSARIVTRDGLRAHRASLLGGEATDIHRSRIQSDLRAADDALAKARTRQGAATAALEAARALQGSARDALNEARADRERADAAFEAACAALSRPRDEVAALLGDDPQIRRALAEGLEQLDRELDAAARGVASRRDDLERLTEGFDPGLDAAALAAALVAVDGELAALHSRSGAVAADLARDDGARLTAAALAGEIAAARAELGVWEEVDEAIGSASGDRFRRFVQAITLDHLVQLANTQLAALSPRYRLSRGSGSDLALHVVDRDMGDELRATRSLSGGERFLVSLALALALSGLEGRTSFVDTLFIDEGFGTLDAETLDLAVDALEALQGRGRKVGVITHVAAMIERIAVQVRVEKRGGGRSQVKVVSAGIAGLLPN